MNARNLPPVLLVEDSAGDIELAQRALAKCELKNPLVVAEDGEQALDLLAGAKGRTRPLRPALILVDLNLPGMDGRQLLRTMKADARWRQIPVVVLSTSVEPADVQACYEAGANSYHRKPDDYRAYQEIFRELTNYWLASVVSPP